MAAATLGTPCTGTCHRPIRPYGIPASDAPGTISDSGHGMCLSCKRHSNGQSMARVNARKARQMEDGILLVTIRPEIMDAARTKVVRWYPGDTELLRMLGMAA